jgi:hypothetical protein
MNFSLARVLPLALALLVPSVALAEEHASAPKAPAHAVKRAKAGAKAGAKRKAAKPPKAAAKKAPKAAKKAPRHVSASKKAAK